MNQHEILIIEDDPVSQRLLSEVVTRLGFKVKIATNGAEGLLFFIRDDRYSAVLLDIMMPEVGGEIFLSVLESLERRKLLASKPRIIIETAVTNYEQLRRYMESTLVYAVHHKPLATDALIDDLKRVLFDEALSAGLGRDSSA